MKRMLRRLSSKSGIGLPTVLGTVIFVTAVAVTIFSVTYSQANNVSRSIIDSEEYKSAVIAVDTTAQLIKNRTDMNASNFESILVGIQDYLDTSTWGQGVTISYDLTSYVITITHPVMLSTNHNVTSYLSPSNVLVEGSMPTTLEEQTDLMSYMPSVEPTTEEEYAEVATDLSSNFLDYYLDAYTTTDPETITGTSGSLAAVVENVVSGAALDPSFILYNPGTRTISYKVNKVNYSETAYHMASSTTLSSTNPQYVNGSLNLAAGQTLTVPNGQALFINGNLLMEGAATLNGNVFVRGNIVVYGNNSSLFATLYAGGYVYSTQNLLLGSMSRPTFIFSNSFVQFANISDEGVVYIFAQEFIYDGGNPDLDGDIHVYSYDTGNIDFTSDAEMEPYNLMTIFESFLDYGLPVMVSDSNSFDSTPAG